MTPDERTRWLIVLGVQIGGVVLSAIQAFPDLRSNRYFSTGAVIFYLLTGSVILLLAMLLRAMRSTKLARPGDAATSAELKRLNAYQLFAVRQLLTAGGMTGAQFADRLQEWGFPIASLAHQREIATVFEIINRETTLLSRDAQNSWHLHDRQGVSRILSTRLEDPGHGG